MSGAGPGEGAAAARVRFEAGVQQGGEAGDLQSDGQLVEPLDGSRWTHGVVHGDAAEHAAQLAHHGGGAQVVPHHVADDQGEVAAGQGEGVVPVAADLSDRPARVGSGPRSARRRVRVAR